MSDPSNPDEADKTADAQADAMKLSLQQDVASWAANRAAGAPSQPLVAMRASGARAATAKPAAKAASGSPAAAKSATPPTSDTSKKPYSMKYDGRPARAHMAERYSRGAR
jgi:hypothetical protein